MAGRREGAADACRPQLTNIRSAPASPINPTIAGYGTLKPDADAALQDRRHNRRRRPTWSTRSASTIDPRVRSTTGRGPSTATLRARARRIMLAGPMIAAKATGWPSLKRGPARSPMRIARGAVAPAPSPLRRRCWRSRRSLSLVVIALRGDTGDIWPHLIRYVMPAALVQTVLLLAGVAAVTVDRRRRHRLDRHHLPVSRPRRAGLAAAAAARDPDLHRRLRLRRHARRARAGADRRCARCSAGGRPPTTGFRTCARSAARSSSSASCSILTSISPRARCSRPRARADREAARMLGARPLAAGAAASRCRWRGPRSRSASRSRCSKRSTTSAPANISACRR